MKAKKKPETQKPKKKRPREWWLRLYRGKSVGSIAYCKKGAALLAKECTGMKVFSIVHVREVV